jgi:Ca2+-transporting ATPase
MKRKPRSIDAKLFDWSTLLKCFFQGGLALAVTIAIYLFIRHDHTTEAARALAFLTLVVCNLGMILTNRSLTRSSIRMLREKNAAFKWVMTGTVAVMCLVLTIPFLKNMFRFGTVTLNDFFLAMAGGFVAVVLMELVKVVPVLRMTRRFVNNA